MLDLYNYTILHDEIMTKLENGEITTETAAQLNTMAFNKYITENATGEDDFYIDFFVEGVNWDVHKQYRQSLKYTRQSIREIRKLIRMGEFDAARECAKGARKEIKIYHKKTMNLINTIDPNSISTAFFGWILRDITILCRDFLFLLIPYGKYVVAFRGLIDMIQDIENTVKKSFSRKTFVAGDLNRYVNFVEKSYETFDRTFDTIEKKIDTIEKNNAEFEKEIDE